MSVMRLFRKSLLSPCSLKGAFPTSKLPPPTVVASYAKKVGLGGKGSSGQMEKKKLPVETDPEKLVNYVCGLNFYKEGEDVKIGPDSEYPDWIWELRLGKRTPVHDMDPNTLEYWRSVQWWNIARAGRLMSSQKCPEMRINEKDKLRKLKELRFRALAGYYHDPSFAIQFQRKPR